MGRNPQQRDWSSAAGWVPGSPGPRLTEKTGSPPGRGIHGADGVAASPLACHSPHQSSPPVCGQIPTCRSFSCSMGGRVGGILRHSPQSGPRLSNCPCRQKRQLRQDSVPRGEAGSGDPASMVTSVSREPTLEIRSLGCPGPTTCPPPAIDRGLRSPQCPCRPNRAAEGTCAPAAARHGFAA